MPARGEPQDGAPSWIDLATRDLDATIAFYTGLFGWEHMSFGEEMGGYGQFLHGGRPIAGVEPDKGGPGPAWAVYLSTTDIDSVAERTTTHGGTVLSGPDEAPGQGWSLMTADATGVPVAYWQSGAHVGFARVAEPGAPCWFEVWSDDFDAALPYYRDVASWTPVHMPDDGGFRYATNGPEDRATAGIYDAHDDLAGKPSWVVYLGASDVDAAAARAVELGARITEEPVDTPFGRMAGVLDPEGASFRLIAA